MNQAWEQELRQRGARFEAGRVLDFGDPVGERLAAVAGPTLHALGGYYGLLLVEGEEAASFLQGQLTSDLRQIDAGHVQWSAHCSPKGRVLANMLIWREAEGFALQLPLERADYLCSRLARYVLRARVRISPASDRHTVLGLAGQGAGTVLAEAMGMGAPGPLKAVRREDVVAIGLAAELFVVAVAPARAPGLWDRLIQHATPVGDAIWEWHLIQARLPLVTAATGDQFLPQMLGLDALGAVSFEKGCYPGQEIIARTQHRGEVKRRLYLLHAASDGTAPGVPVFARSRETPVGTVLNTASAPGGGEDLLAVAFADPASESELAVGSATGPRVAVIAPTRPHARLRA